MSPDYTALLRGLRDPLQLRAVERIIQFPFVLPVADERTEEEIARATEKRREQGKKLQEMASKARLEKVLSPNMHYFLVVYWLRTACSEGERPAIFDKPERATSRGDQTRVASACLIFLTFRQLFCLLQNVATESAPVGRFQ